MRKLFLLLILFYSCNICSQKNAIQEEKLLAEINNYIQNLPEKIDNKNQFDQTFLNLNNIFNTIKIKKIEYKKFSSLFVQKIKKAEIWAEKNESLQVQLDIKSYLLETHNQLNNPQEIIEIATDLLRYKQSLKKEKVNDILNTMCRGFRLIEAYSEIIKITPLRKKFASNDESVSQIEYDLSLAYYNSKNYNLAIKSFLTNKEYYKKFNDHLFTSSMSNNVGLCYLKLYDYTLAKKYFNLSLTELAAANGKESKGLPIGYNNFFKVLVECNLTRTDVDNKNPQLSIAIFNKFKKMAKTMGYAERGNITDMFMNLSKIYLKTNQVDLSKKYLDSAQSTFDKTISTNTKIDFYNAKAKILLLKNDIAEADKCFYKSSKISDSIQQVQIFRENIITQVKYDIAQKDAEIFNAKLNAAKKEEKLLLQRYTIFGFLIGFFILLLSLYNIFSLSRKQRITNAVLVNQQAVIEKNNIDLNRLNNLNQKIFSVISHDFKAPVLILKNLLSNKKAMLDTKNIGIYLQDINNQLNQTDEILNSLLDWAKIELNLSKIEENEFYLKNFVEQSMFELKEKATEKLIKIQNFISNDQKIQFNELVLKIVLRNVLTNAIKFSNLDSNIEIYFKEHSIYIKDFGTGLDKDLLTKIFKKNIEPGLGTQFESGFGIGLYLCNELINKHQGQLKVTNNEGPGCTFEIILKN